MAGENSKISYNFGKGIYATAVHVTEVGYSTVVVATESHARQTRAMYPKGAAPGRFYIKVALKGYLNYKAFMEYMRGYSKALLNSGTDYGTPLMAVQVLGEDGFAFMRVGIPVGGITDGDRVGAAVYNETITFETVQDPLDTRTFNEQIGVDNVSQFAFGDDYGGGAEDDTTKFFYPMSPGSNDINVKAEDIYNYNGQANLPLNGPGDVGGGRAPVAPGFGSPELLGN